MLGDITDFDDLIRQTRDIRNGVLGLNELTRLSRELAAVPVDVFRNREFEVRRIAILSGYTFQPIRELLRPHLLWFGICPEFYECSYNTFEQVIFARDGDLEAFDPHLVYFCVGSDHLLIDRPNDVQRWQTLWRATHDWLGCDIVQNLFEQPAIRVFGNIERQVKASWARMIHQLDEQLIDEHPAYVHFHDTDHLAAQVGRCRWRDQTLYDLAKIPVAYEYHDLYACSLASQIAGIFGRSKKCLVLDLDNTLWGGVVGDLGWKNIEFGQGNPTGEAFLRFQEFVKSLSQRGIILSVCSKNEESIARTPFVQRDDFVLKLSDFAAFVANWKPKDQNIQAIAKELNIGLEAMVFVDDNPSERDWVRRRLPEVTVHEMPEDPALYALELSQGNYFDTPSITAEDMQRSHHYQAKAARQELEASSGSYEDFLDSLEMQASFCSFNDRNIVRVTQLINKTNQFNLCTHRYTQAQVEAFTEDTDALTLCVRLRDRFGDHGVVSAAIVTGIQGACQLDTWVMSCRVFSRTLEFLFFAELVRRLQQRGSESLVTRYLATAKNKVVAGLFELLELTKVAEVIGESRWTLDLSNEELVDRYAGQSRITVS